MPDSSGPGGGGFTLSTARWPEVEAGPRRLLVVPVGSLEQHGPHLPMDTDTRIAAAVAARACAGRSGVGLAPAIAIGASGEHADFPGTLSIGSAALSAVLVELGRHASLHWPAMLLVNGHGGNVTAIRDAVRKLSGEGRSCHVWHAAVRNAEVRNAEVRNAEVRNAEVRNAEVRNAEVRHAEVRNAEVRNENTGNDAHAGRTETSIMLALAPGDVRLGDAVPGENRTLAEILPDLRARGVRQVSPSGVLGDPSGASAAEGEHLLGLLTADLGAVLDGLLETRAG